MVDDAPIYTNETSPKKKTPYETKLSDKEEEKFQKWIEGRTNAAGGQLVDDLPDYDVRGWWKSGAATAENGHGSDKWKKPSHPTFSDESIYHGVGGHEGGSWKKDDGKWTFTPGKTNIENGIDRTRDYLRESDPDVTLVEPPE